VFAVSDRFEQSVTRSHDVAVLCEIVDETGQSVVDTLDVISGTVTADATQKTRRQCTVVFQDSTGNLVPDDVHDLLQPYSGYYIRLWRGIAWRDGTSEIVPLGTFAPYAPRITDTDNSLEISIAGYDRSKIISRSSWVLVFTIDSGTNMATAIRNLINDRMPGLNLNFEPTAWTVPLTTFGATVPNDPWDDASSLAEAHAMELFFDARDNLILQTIPDPTVNQVVYEFEEGENCVVTSLVRSSDASKQYTGVIIIGEGSAVTPLIRTELWRTDTDLRIPYTYNSSYIQTMDQANIAASAILRKLSSAQTSVDVRCVPDPRLELGDVVRIKRARSRLDDVFVITGMSVPLDAGSEMSITVAQRRSDVPLFIP
jgi:hypothetical protein